MPPDGPWKSSVNRERDKRERKEEREREREREKEKGHCPGRPHKPAGGRERCRGVWSTAFVLS